MRTVKDFLIQSGGQSGIEVQKEMVKQCKSSRSKCQKHLEEKRAQKKEEEKQKQNEVWLIFFENSFKIARYKV